MTNPTRDIFSWLMEDFIRVSKVSREHNIFNDQDIKNCLKKIEVVNFHEQTELDGIKFTPYFAGHVLGACMYDIEIAGVRVRCSRQGEGCVCVWDAQEWVRWRRVALAPTVRDGWLLVTAGPRADSVMCDCW